MLDSENIDWILGEHKKPISEINFVLRSLCPFVVISWTYCHCLIEGWIISTVENKNLKTPCACHETAEFRECPTFKKAMSQYDTNREEFKAYVVMANDKIRYKAKHGQSP